MQSIDTLIQEAAKLSQAQQSEIVAMAKGMVAANKIRQDRGT